MLQVVIIPNHKRLWIHQMKHLPNILLLGQILHIDNLIHDNSGLTFIFEQQDSYKYAYIIIQYQTVILPSECAKAAKDWLLIYYARFVPLIRFCKL